MSIQSSLSQPSPPTPARRRVPRPMPQPPERQNSPGPARRCYRQQHVPDGMSPPPRRAHSAQSHHQDSRQTNGENWQDPSKSPVKRPQSAGANWKNNPKVAPHNTKSKKSDEYRKDTDISGSSQDVSQITYNPTFQTHSPAHSVKQQPYIAQIVSYPMSRQVTPPSPPKYIAPPEEYQDPQNNLTDTKHNNQKQMTGAQGSTQSHIYYIHGNTTATLNQDLAQQRQQTAIHLQQYVAMKQAQQQMFSYLQRSPHTVFPNIDFSQNTNQARMYDDEFTSQYGHPSMRTHSAPTPVGVVRPIPIPVGPGFGIPDTANIVQMPMWPPPMPPVVSAMGPWIQGQVPPEMQYYPQSQFMPMYRPTSAGSAGTLTRYKKDTSDGEVKNVCQSINLVRQKPIGQIVSLPGQELTVCNNVSDSPSPASVSTDSGVSPGNSVPNSKNSSFNASSNGTGDTFNIIDKNKKNRSVQQNTRSLKNAKSLDN